MEGQERGARVMGGVWREGAREAGREGDRGREGGPTGVARDQGEVGSKVARPPRIPAGDFGPVRLRRVAGSGGAAQGHRP